jgi:hypothetical protein
MQPIIRSLTERGDEEDCGVQWVGRDMLSIPALLCNKARLGPTASRYYTSQSRLQGAVEQKLSFCRH